MKTAEEIFNGVYLNLGYMYDRWQDEKEYEDWSEYEEVMQNKIKEIEPAAELKRAVRRPFGCVFTLDNKTYQIKITSREASYVRLA